MPVELSVRSQRVAAALAIVILMLVAALLVLGLQREQKIQFRILQSAATQTSIHDLSTVVLAAEAGQRGYVLTGDRAFLAPYEASRHAVGERLGRLKGHYATNPTQSARLDALAGSIGVKFRNLATGIVVRDQQGLGAATALIAASEEQRQMDLIREQTSALAAGEADQLNQQTQEAAKLRVQRDLMIVFLLLALVVMGGVMTLRTRRRAADQAQLLAHTAEGAARLQAVFDSAVDGIVTINPNGSIESINRAALALFGYEPSDILRRDISSLLDLGGDSRGWFLRRLATEGDASEGFLREMPARRRDGSVFPVDVALGAMSLPDGRHVVAVIRDISERRRVDEMKDEFVATVSHELRTPLTSIAGSLGLLQGGAGGALPPRAARLVDIAEANSRRLVRLINDILDMEKVGAEATVLAREPLDLNRLVQTSIQSMAGLASDRSVELTLAEPDPPLAILGDQDRLVQVLNNLLSNAIKFSPPRSEVQVRIEASGGFGQVTIADQGPGVPEAFRDKLFRKFAQADGSNTRDHGGTGLGLAIAKEIVERLGGTIGYQPGEAGGAVFHICLPLAADQVLERHSPSESRFLICEDDVLTAEMIRDDFEYHGMLADVVGTANEARHALHSRTYAGLVLDMHLPDSNGVTLIRVLRGAPATRDLPIVVVSGGRVGREEAAELGIVEWLDKPVDLVQLRHLILTAEQDGVGRPALILHIDDDRDMQEVASGLLGASGSVVFAESLAAARAALARQAPDLVILDIGLPDGSGLQILPELTGENGAPIPTLIYTAQELDTDSLPPSVEAVLIKSRASLPELARVARDVIKRHPGGSEGA